MVWYGMAWYGLFCIIMVKGASVWEKGGMGWYAMGILRLKTGEMG